MWRQSRKYVKAVLNLITAVVILLFVVFVVPSVISYFMPFVIGWIIAMIANPLVRFLDEKIKIRRKAGSAIVIIAVIAAIILGVLYFVGRWYLRDPEPACRTAEGICGRAAGTLEGNGV